MAYFRETLAAVIASKVILFGAIKVYGSPVMDFLICVALTLGYRCLVRILDRQGAAWNDDAAHAVIIGSGRDAVLVPEELRAGGIRALRPVCLLDPAGHGATGHLRGLPVRSGVEGGRGWLARHPVVAAIVVRRDGWPGA